MRHGAVQVKLIVVAVIQIHVVVIEIRDHVARIRIKLQALVEIPQGPQADMRRHVEALGVVTGRILPVAARKFGRRAPRSQRAVDVKHAVGLIARGKTDAEVFMVSVAARAFHVAGAVGPPGFNETGHGPVRIVSQAGAGHEGNAVNVHITARVVVR